MVVTPLVLQVSKVWTLGTNSNPPYLVEVSEGEDGIDTYDYAYNLAFHSVAIPVWESEPGKAELTVSDLADSIEAMLARRESGLPAPTTMSAMRSYPTDPGTQRSAAAFLKQIQEDGKKELAELDAVYKASKQQKADAKAKADAEAKEFAEYKANKGAIKS